MAINRTEETASNIGPEQWSAVARQWEQIGQPLRPSPQDIDFASNAVTSWINRNGVPRVLILGVTPELYNLSWPPDTDIMAVDHTQTMIDVVWPGPKDAAICAEWTEIPVPEESRDIILCDGGFHLMSYPNEQIKFAETLARIVTAGGMCVFRLFVPPAEPENYVDVIGYLLAGRISSLNILKLRLGMSLQEDARNGVKLADVWDTLHEAAPDLEKLADNIGWSHEHISVIHAYKNSPNRYYFVTIEEMRHIFCEIAKGFVIEEISTPTYLLGERCPSIVLRRTSS